MSLEVAHPTEIHRPLEENYSARRWGGVWEVQNKSPC